MVSAISTNSSSPLSCWTIVGLKSSYPQLDFTDYTKARCSTPSTECCWRGSSWTLFFSDTNVDSRDPVQLNLLYVQCRDGILRVSPWNLLLSCCPHLPISAFQSLHPVTKEIACDLGALQCQIEYGDFPENKPKFYIEWVCNSSSGNYLPEILLMMQRRHAELSRI